jgi:diguanylate cyclase (GGDEF)-like protein
LQVAGHIPSLRAALLSILVVLSIVGLPAQEPGLLRVGADIDYPPYSFVDSSGDPTGFDIELIRLVADRLGLETQFHLDSWDRVLEDLAEKRTDVVVGALFTISRTDSFIFTDPYNTDTISIFVREESSIDSLRALEDRSAAVMAGDAIPETVLSTNGIDSQLQTYPTLTEALRSVSNGSTDYSLVPFAVGMELTREAEIDNLRVAGPPVYTIQYRLAVHRTQEGFRDQLNGELDALIETAEYENLRGRWLRHRRQELSFATVFRYVAPAVIPGLIILLVAWVWTLKRQVSRQTQRLAEQSAELRALATQDELTGLANRRLFDTIAEKELSRAKRRGDAIAMLFMDLDHFKKVNDSYGHASGDVVLKEFAQRASNELRQYDTLARYGGEEFVALLRDADDAEALNIAERIRSACDAAMFSLGPEKPSVHITVSVGVAVLSTDDRALEDLVTRADRALYRAKNAGRDCVRAL